MILEKRKIQRKINPKNKTGESGKTKKDATEESVNLVDFIDVKGWKAIGNKLGGTEILSIELLPSEEEPEEESKANELTTAPNKCNKP